MKIAGINLLEFGNTYQIAGIIFNKEYNDKILYLPGNEPVDYTEEYEVSLEEWQAIIQQTDLLEVEVEGPLDEVKKALVRKTARQIEQAISWAVYKRDSYACRYCGKDDIPLTVDHLVLWEKGGPSTIENLVASCKKCNRTRGNTEYNEWLKSDYYKKVCTNLDGYTMLENQAVALTLASIPRVKIRKKR